MINQNASFAMMEIHTKWNLVQLSLTMPTLVNLSKAAQLNTNDISSVGLNAACNPSDAHAIDVQYHPTC